MRADLHIHTTASDGAWTPEQVVEGAASGSLELIALADHDTTAGVAAAEDAAAPLGIRVLPAIELSTARDGREFHILGYGVDREAPLLRAHEERARGARIDRMETMVARLRKAGVLVEMEAVLLAAGAGGGVLGRPHLARALMASGHVGSLQEAFHRYIGEGLPAFQPLSLLDPVQGVEVIVAAGGIAVWAHPPRERVDALLPELIRAGLKGLEVYRPLSLPDHVRRMERIARRAGLFFTGGSDWHSPDRDLPLGEFYVDEGKISTFMKAAGL